VAYSTVISVRTAVSPDVPQEGFDNPPSTPTHTAADLSNGTLTDAIAEADATIDSYLANRYVTPVDTTNGVPHPIDFWSRNIAAYLATLTYRKSKDVSVDDPIVRRYTATMQALTSVQRNLASLPLPELSTSSEGPEAAGDAINQYSGHLFDSVEFDLEAAQPGLGGLPLHGVWWSR
jgi:phage gp36-like protein